MLWNVLQKGVVPLLVGFLANGDIAAKKYAEVTNIRYISRCFSFVHLISRLLFP
jgi:hypothetical protein